MTSRSDPCNFRHVPGTDSLIDRWRRTPPLVVDVLLAGVVAIVTVISVVVEGPAGLEPLDDDVGMGVPHGAVRAAGVAAAGAGARLVDLLDRCRVVRDAAAAGSAADVRAAARDLHGGRVPAAADLAADHGFARRRFRIRDLGRRRIGRGGCRGRLLRRDHRLGRRRLDADPARERRIDGDAAGGGDRSAPRRRSVSRSHATCTTSWRTT